MMDIETPNSPTGSTVSSDEMNLLMKSIRRIVRANDLGSRSLQKSSGLTAPQLAVLRAVGAQGEISTGRIAEQVDLSAATVVTILDNLERDGLVTRERSLQDRRIVHTRLTEAGAATLMRVQGPFGETLMRRLSALPARNRRQMIEALDAFANLIAMPEKQG